MRSKLVTVALVGVIAFLMATNPVVADAARQVTGADIENGTVTSRDIKNHTLRARDFEGGVARLRGPQGPAGARGSVGPIGARGPVGTPGTARAYGVFQTDGLTASADRIKALVVVTKPGTGRYCLGSSAVDAEESIPVVSADRGAVSVTAQINSAAPDCPADTWEVLTFRTSNGAAIDSGFSAIIP